MPSMRTEVEIAAPPTRVREVFLDWPRIPQWHQGFIKSIDPLAQKTTIEPGDTLKVVLQGMTFQPTVLENSEHQFVWSGSLPYVFTGRHYFRYEPSKITPGSTTFVHGEDFSGPLAFLMTFFGGNTLTGFKKVNQDLKQEAEKGS